MSEHTPVDTFPADDNPHPGNPDNAKPVRLKLLRKDGSFTVVEGDVRLYALVVQDRDVTFVYVGDDDGAGISWHRIMRETPMLVLWPDNATPVEVR